MNTIIRIRELDAYLVLFMDWNTIYICSVLSKEMYQIVTNHQLFKLLKEYHEDSNYYKSELTWATAMDKPLVLDWRFNLGIGFESVFELVDNAIIHASINVLDWFYRKGIFDYTLISLHRAIIYGLFDSIDWFYNHGLEIAYLNDLFSNPEAIVNNCYGYDKLLAALKWLYQRKYSIDFGKINLERMFRIISVDWIEFVKWLLEKQVIGKTIFKDRFKFFLYNIENLAVEKQLEILTLLKELGHDFSETRNLQFDEPIFESLFNLPFEVRKWCLENIPGVTIEQIFTFAAKTSDIETVKWTGIDKNHPKFTLIEHKPILERAIDNHHMEIIDWYFNNITFNEKILMHLHNAFIEGTNNPKLTIEKIKLFKKYFKKYERPYLLFYPTAIKNAYNEANIPVLEYLLSKIPSGTEIYICAWDIAHCISNGHIDSLRWIEKYLHKDSDKIKIDMDDNGMFLVSIDSAARHGYFETIKWTYQFLPHKFGYTHAIDSAAHLCHVDILNWFNDTFGTSTEFTYSEFAIDMSVCYCGTQAIKWFHSSEHPVKYTNSMIDNAIHHEKIHIIQWLKENKYPIYFSSNSIRIACASGLINLNWLKHNGVIKILSREFVNDLLVFKIELSQPFIKSERTNVIYNANSISIIYDCTNYYYMNNLTVEYDDEQNNNITDVPSVPSVSGMPRIIKISYKYDTIINMENVTRKPQYEIYHGMCWFERWHKLSNWVDPLIGPLVS